MRQVAASELELAPQRHLGGVALIERVAEQLGEARDHALGGGRVVGDQRRDGVQRVEQEVRLQLLAQRVELRLGEMALELGLALAATAGPGEGAVADHERQVDDHVGVVGAHEEAHDLRRGRRRRPSSPWMSAWSSSVCRSELGQRHDEPQAEVEEESRRPAPVEELPTATEPQDERDERGPRAEVHRGLGELLRKAGRLLLQAVEEVEVGGVDQ